MFYKNKMTLTHILYFFFAISLILKKGNIDCQGIFLLCLILFQNGNSSMGEKESFDNLSIVNFQARNSKYRMILHLS